MLFAFALYLFCWFQVHLRSLLTTFYMKLFSWFLYFLSSLPLILYICESDMRWTRKAKRLKNDENILSKKLIFNMIYAHDFYFIFIQQQFFRWIWSGVQPEPEHDSHFSWIFVIQLEWNVFPPFFLLFIYSFFFMQKVKCWTASINISTTTANKLVSQ